MKSSEDNDRNGEKDHVNIQGKRNAAIQGGKSQKKSLLPEPELLTFKAGCGDLD